MITSRRGSSIWILSGWLPGRSLARFLSRSPKYSLPVLSTYFCAAEFLPRYSCWVAWKWAGFLASLSTLMAAFRAVVLGRQTSLVATSSAREYLAWKWLLYIWPLTLSVFYWCSWALATARCWGHWLGQSPLDRMCNVIGVLDQLEVRRWCCKVGQIVIEERWRQNSVMYHSCYNFSAFRYLLPKTNYDSSVLQIVV